MKKKQQYIPLHSSDTPPKLVAPNRKTRRAFESQGSEFAVNYNIIEQTSVVNVKKAELSQHKKEVARQFGSKTGKLKKKHFQRQKYAEYLEQLEDTAMDNRYDNEGSKI